MKRKTHVLILCLTSTLLVTMLYDGKKFSFRHQTNPKKAATSRKIISPKNTIPDSFKNLYQKNIAQREYHITWDKDKDCPQSPNRKQNLRAYYQPGVLKVQNRVDSSGNNFQLTLITRGIYADGKKLYIPSKTSPSEISDNRLLLKHPGFTEEYINNEQGIRQNFIVESAPSHTKKLQVRLSPEGMNVEKLPGNTLEFYLEKAGKKTNQLTYDSLKCWDANGKGLKASLAFQNGQINIEVDVHRAVYPVTIDPVISKGVGLLSTVSTILEGFQAGARFGAALSSAGDVNGDGFSDVIVGAPGYFDNEPNQGAFFIYLGTSSGLQTNTAPYTRPPLQNDFLGKCVSSAGDLNGDGFSDIAVAAPGEKAVFIYYGSAASLNPDPVKISISQNSADFGSSVNCAGDINGDGFSDLIIGAKKFSAGPVVGGAAFIFNGSMSGIVTVPADTMLCLDPGAEFGHAVASAGDVNGDGFSDIIIGAPYYHSQPNVSGGGAFIYHGSPAGIAETPALKLPGKHALSRFGYSVSSAGDFNGDGFSDIIIGANTYSKQNNEGATFFYPGKNDGSGIDLQKESPREGGQANSHFGESVACLGDINGDGFSDIIIGISAAEVDNYQGSGYVHVLLGNKNAYMGGASGCSVQQNGAQTGTAVASAGDVNGDGLSDMLIGAPGYHGSGANEGAALVFNGSFNSTLEQSPSTTLKSKQHASYFGQVVAQAGDVNGDGYRDVIVGAPDYDHGELDEGAAFIYYGTPTGLTIVGVTMLEMNQAKSKFGYSVSSAGDTNGDGYDDVIVGARDFDVGGYSASGAAYIYYGSPSGLSTASPNILYVLQANAHLGISVAGGGDLNGDGYDDVVASVSGYNGGPNSKGAMLVAYGSATGIPSESGTLIQSYINNSFGSTVSCSSDVNGDGFDDVIVGAKYYENNVNMPWEGAIFVYHGGKSGIQTGPSSILESNSEDARLGESLSGAGDVNGDGYDDIVVGAPNYTGNLAKCGAAFLYYGSEYGLYEMNKVIIQGNIAFSEFGASVAGGDLNGDGYSDVIVGAPSSDFGAGKQGAVMIYEGSEDGLIWNKNIQIIKANQLLSYYGKSVSASDINGDGADDLIIGAPTNFSDMQTSDGAVFVFHGNENMHVGDDTRSKNSVRAYETNLDTPLKQSNSLELKVGIGITTKSFLGRNKAKIVWECRKEGQSFSKASPITNSVQFSGQGNYEVVQFDHSELKSLVAKVGRATKIRTRIKYHPALAITGQVYGPWRYLRDPVIANLEAMPVELISFKATVIENQVQLSWATASEVNSDHFEIQRSADGKAWEKIGEIPALQNSNSNHHYTFSDINPLKGRSYYRLKMIDLDGTSAYSHIDSVNIKSKLTFYPNPTAGALQIDSEEHLKEITVYNASGTKVLILQNAQGFKSIDLGQLPAGKYLIYTNGQVIHVVKK